MSVKLSKRTASERLTIGPNEKTDVPAVQNCLKYRLNGHGKLSNGCCKRSKGTGKLSKDDASRSKRHKKNNFLLEKFQTDDADRSNHERQISANEKFRTNDTIHSNLMASMLTVAKLGRWSSI